jgi:hypothetical protein
MPKPAKIQRPVHKNLSLPEDLVGRVELELYSEVQQRVPMGAWQALVTELLTDWLQRRGIQT